MISKNSAWSIAGSAVPAAAAVLTIPILFTALGDQVFSVYSLLTSLAIFFFVYDFGLSRSVTYFIARSDTSRHATNAVWRQAALGAAGCSLAAVLLITLATPWFVNYWLHMDTIPPQQLIQSFRMAAYGIPASVFCNICKGVLEGHTDFRRANLGKMVSGTTIFIAPLILVELRRLELQDLSLAITFSRYFSLGLYVALVRGKINFYPLFTSNASHPSLFKYGAWAGLSGLISTLFVYGDRFLVAGYVEPETLSIYIASQDILIRYLLIPWSMANVLLPILSSKKLTNSEENRHFNYHQTRIFWLSVAFTLIVLSILWLLIDLLDLITLNSQAKIIISLQTIGVFFAAISQLPLILLYAKGRPQLVTCIYGLEFLLYIFIAPFILPLAEGVGASVIWSGRLILEYFFLSFAIKRKK